MDTTILRKDDPQVYPDETPHACYEGFVYIGHIVDYKNGEPVEEIELVPYRRCNPENV